MMEINKKVKVVAGVTPDAINFDELMAAQQPVILQGLVRQWPMVQAALNSHQSAMDYLKSFYNGRTVGSYWAGPEIKGRYGYNETLTDLNFERRRVPLTEMLESIQTHLYDDAPPSRYVGSTSIDACLPGFRAANDLPFTHPMFEQNPPLASIWLGNPSVVAAHYDAPNNIACCVAGKRRFTLFPPDQIANLYPGPLEPTPGGQAISLVDFANPDLERFPGFSQALEVAQVADLEPGDALFYPSMWWHQVEGLDRFNVMINYWWNTSPGYMGTPMNVLKHALLSLRDRPKHEREAWRSVFDYYVFGEVEQSRAHIPEHARGELAPLDDIRARQLRAWLINRLNR
ncbi:cupin-like domain-containing protein [Gilvimarinus sp. DA14]|uniref:cupin-like domain-containing protein n=1 Tax=Gilvimarinus sp. DA14 TaxID=2956798 RepID=UPI0020B6EBC8|nr:cupin-like domain-containing protein [Gilvimarinus sp. DA14]UTF60302.1 cupin-like domain-containing protein [Gilvimarinus sp. DA14]